MNRMQEQVAEFHRALGLPIGTSPAISRGELRSNLINEESLEFAACVAEGDIVGAADAIADLLYVVFGSAVEFGIDIAPIFDEVHRSNMAKVGGPRRADGKVLKPPGWTPPDVAGELAKQMEH